MFRKTMLAALIATAAPVAAHAQAAPATANQSAKMQEASAIIAIMFPPAERDQKMHDMLTNITTQMKNSMGQLESVGDPGLKAIIDRFVDNVPDKLMPTVQKYFPSMLEAQAEAYTHEFSLEELKQIHAFAMTPAGKHYFSKMTDLLKDPAVAKANERYFAALQGLQQQEAMELRKEIMAYLKAHPDVAKKLEAGRK
ncbi:DUF2059 domain-containing protein [Porphyrobacter algicida]|uniref:DUF2059 domain-containing protein n=1 Tax=Qipengyuania algicida TaxID=1836209 RepID=A0A845AHJ7_9SPHN|nr:DUF2059 domain-containing protein [Qipengyuania algicida]MXP28909.1 DUF2059 domain-containing protein [Qipengyuania algicida]